MATATLPAPPKREAKILTYDDYLAEGRVEGHYDILDGERVFMSGASYLHQCIVIRLILLLSAFEANAQIGRVLTAPFDILIRLSPLRTRQPDVLYISQERLTEAGITILEGPLSVGPELIIEVLSPSETARSVRSKLTDLAEVGVCEAWLVSPEAETVQVMRLSPEAMETAATYGYDQTVVSEVISGLTVSVARIFED